MSIASTIANVLHSYAELLTWPVVVLVGVILYRRAFLSLLPGAKVRLTISGVSFETTLPVIEHSITESLRGEELSDEQWSWLQKLYAEGRTPFSESDLTLLRPLRNAGLIRAFPKGFLQTATAVQLTSLGKLLVEASGYAENRKKRK